MPKVDPGVVHLAPTKKVESKVDLRFDWSAWLGNAVVTMFDFEPKTGDLQVSEVTTTPTSQILRVEGGVQDKAYRVTSKIVTSEGEAESQSIIQPVRDP